MAVKAEYEKNGFDILRYAAALSVMLLHYSSYAMILSEKLPVHAGAVMDKTREIALLFPGVVMLFAISGFLVSASFERAKTREEFCACILNCGSVRLSIWQWSAFWCRSYWTGA